MPIPLRAACWFLTALAAASALGLLWKALVQFRTERFVAVVAGSQIRLEKRMVPERRSPSRKRPGLFAVAQLRLNRAGQAAGAELQTMVEREIPMSDVAAMPFLEDWAVGSRHDAALSPGGRFELHPRPAWEALFGLGALTWMLSGFAWIAWGAASEAPASPGMGWRVAFLGLLVVVAAGQGLVSEQLAERREQSLGRVAVEGRARHVTSQKVLEELRAAGIRVIEPEQVLGYLAGKKLGYCEYEWLGRKWRSGSMWTLPEEGEVCKGWVNPAESRDVKWTRE